MYARKPGGRSLTDQLGGNAGAALDPGKRTLTDQLGAGPAPVQLKPTGGAAPAPAPTKAAPRLRVEALDARGAVIKAWEGDAHDAAHGRARFVAERDGARWRWNDADGATTRLGITEDSAGVPVERWAPRGAVRIIVTIGGGTRPPDREREGDGGEGSDTASGAGAEPKRLPVSGVDLDIAGGDHLEAGDTDQLGDDQADDLDLDQAEDLDADGAVPGGLAEAFGRELARLAGNGEGTAGDGRGDDREGTQAGDLGGAGPGVDSATAPRGGQHGIAGGLTTEEGGVDSATAERGGQKFGDPVGAYGGEGREGDHGARGAVALFGGLVNVPAALRPFVELALIVSDGNIAGLSFTAGKAAGVALLKDGIRHLTPEAARTALAREARHFAAARMRTVQKGLSKDRGFRALAREEQRQVLRVAYWEQQRQYFEGALAAAHEQHAKVSRKLAKTTDPRRAADLRRQLDAADQLEDIARVQPVAGRLPANHRYAGKSMPLPAEKRAAVAAQGLDVEAIPFTPDGYPDFSTWAKADVQINLTGSSGRDFTAAYAEAGMRPQRGWIWHHHQELGRMQLVPVSVHDAARHTGGVAQYRHVTGDITSYPERPIADPLDRF